MKKRYCILLYSRHDKHNDDDMYFSRERHNHYALYCDAGISCLDTKYTRFTKNQIQQLFKFLRKHPKKAFHTKQAIQFTQLCDALMKHSPKVASYLLDDFFMNPQKIQGGEYQHLIKLYATPVALLKYLRSAIVPSGIIDKALANQINDSFKDTGKAMNEKEFMQWMNKAGKEAKADKLNQPKYFKRALAQALKKLD